MVSIDIRNITNSHIDEKAIRGAINKTLLNLGIHSTISIGVVLVGRDRMRKLNNQYNFDNHATDVLSFGSGRHFVVPKDFGNYLGEIVVCLEVVRRQATRAKEPFLKEFTHVLVHGALHLLGYEHEKSAKDTERMHAKEEEIMKLLKL